MQVARDGGDNRIDAIELEHLFPFGGSPRRFWPRSETMLQSALQVRRVDVAHGPHLHPRDLEQVLQQNGPAITDTHDPDADGVVRTSLGRGFVGKKLPGHHSPARTQESSTMNTCHGSVLSRKKIHGTWNRSGGVTTDPPDQEIVTQPISDFTEPAMWALEKSSGPTSSGSQRP